MTDAVCNLVPVTRRTYYFVVRCDNASACDIVASGRTTSAPIAATLDALREIERRHGLWVTFNHIAGEKNLVADKLSRAQSRPPDGHSMRLVYR